MQYKHRSRIISTTTMKISSFSKGHLLSFILVFGFLGGVYALRNSFAASLPITVSQPGQGAATCSTRFSSEDVWPGYFYENSAPAGSPTLTQRIDALGLDVWRVQAVSGYNDANNSKPFPQAYTGTDGHSVTAWNFTTLDKVLSDGTASAARLLDITSPPDSLWSTTGPLPADASGPGTLSDQTYGALAQYYANIAKYMRTGILQTNSGATVTYTSASLTDTSKDFTAYGAGGYAVTATVLDANGFPDWVTGTISSVTNSGHTVNLSATWSTTTSVGTISNKTPVTGAAYNLASSTPPITSPANAKPWPRPPSVGNVQYFELFNESDLSNSFFPRSSPTLLAPTPTLTPVNVAGGTLTPGTTYAYRLTAVAINTGESVPGTEASVTLPSGMNAIQVTWSATTNLGLSPFAYRIYGRSAGAEKAMVVVGRDASTGFTWTDKGSVTPSGALPTSDHTAGLQLWRAREYTKMWNAVAPAIKTVDPTVKLVGPVISNPQSLAVLNTNTTAVTTGPSDTSWKDSTDYVPFLMANGNPKPDVVSYHSYGNSNGSGSSDASYFSGLLSAISDYKSTDESSVGSLPAWNTETNIDAGFLDNTDFRAITQLGSAWLADEMIQYCQQAPSVQELFQFEVANTNTWNLFGENPPAGCYPQPNCLNMKAGEPNLEYWMIYWASRYFPAGSTIAPITNVPAGFVALAAQAPGSTKISVIVANIQVGSSAGVGVAGSTSVQLSGITSTDTKQVIVDGNTDVTSGPTETDLGAVSSVNLSMNGYGVALLSFDTGSGVADSTAPSVPTNLHTTSVGNTSVSLAWNASTDNAGGSGVAGYRLYRGGTLVATIPVANGTTYTDSGLSPSTAYSYSVSAYDYANNESAQSTAVNTTTSSSAPAPGDCNADGHVTIIDLSILLTHYGITYAACDFNSDNTVNIFDLSILLTHYGT